MIDFALPGDRRPARLEAADEGAPAADPRGGAGDRRAEQARALRRRRHAERRRLRRAARARRGGRAAGDHDADGQGRVPRVARAPLRLARDARREVVEPRDEHLRRPRRGRRALRRPRHRQARRVRARRDGRPPRHRRRPRSRSSARRTSPSSARSRRRCTSSPTRSRAHRAEGVAGAPRRGSSRSRDWREEFPLRYGSSDEWLKPQ